MNRLLAIDIGNTQVVVGAHDGASWTSEWRISTVRTRSADEWGSILTALLSTCDARLSDYPSVAISSVVPRVTMELRQMVRKYCGSEAFVVGPGVKTGVRILTDNPREVGADRVVNSLATHHRYGGPAIVVDFGTATTFDVVSADGDYMGGAIAPGLAISAEALQQYTAKLQEVELVRPPSAVGRNTVEAMQSGLVLGYAGLVEGLIHSIQRETGSCKVIGTGGLVSIVAQATDVIDVVDNELTLEGLRLMYDLNRTGQHEAGDRAPVGIQRR